MSSFVSSSAGAGWALLAHFLNINNWVKARRGEARFVWSPVCLTADLGRTRPSQCVGGRAGPRLKSQCSGTGTAFSATDMLGERQRGRQR